MAEYVFVIAAIASGAAIAVDTANTIAIEKDRRRQLRLEKKNAELAALDEQNERLRELSAANSENIANSGNLDPFASMSLIAGRAFNFRAAESDQENIRVNLATTRAQIATKIDISRRNESTAKTTGLLNIVAIGAGAVDQFSQLGKPAIPPPTPPAPAPKKKRRRGTFE